MSLSSSDIANANANDARRSADDLRVLVDWLLDRVAALETTAGQAAPPRPELPSEQTQRIFRESMEQQHLWFSIASGNAVK